MKALITGCSGFIGTHLIRELESCGYDVFRTDLHGANIDANLDILNQTMVDDVVDSIRPDVIYNLAGQANVSLSWEKPQLTFQLNTIGAVNILDAVKRIDKKIRVIGIGSADEYGVLKEKGENVSENITTNPITPYAISKCAQEQFFCLYSKVHCMNVCMVRIFNLGGFGQSKGFMISDFASGIAEIEAGKKDFLSVGNLDSARDFTHVKDACRALRLLSEKGHRGEIYNISSGKTYTAKEILDKLILMSTKKIKVVQDATKLRPCDTPVVCGNHDKLSNHTGWAPKFGLDQILADALSYWRDKVNSVEN